MQSGLRTLLLFGALTTAAALPGRAVVIDNLAFAANVIYPADGNFYALPLVVDFTLGIGDFAGGFLPIQFVDSVFPITYDAVQIVVPAGLKGGTELQVAVNFSMGCTNSPTPNVNGPLGSINNDATTGDFSFSSLSISQVGSHIDCLALTGPPGPTPPPEYKNPTDRVPSPPPYNPYGQDLLPRPYLNANNSVATEFQAVVIPEPGGLAMAGLA